MRIDIKALNLCYVGGWPEPHIEYAILKWNIVHKSWAGRLLPINKGTAEEICYSLP